METTKILIQGESIILYHNNFNGILSGISEQKIAYILNVISINKTIKNRRSKLVEYESLKIPMVNKALAGSLYYMNGYFYVQISNTVGNNNFAEVICVAI